MKFSIVTPSYNQAPFLTRMLNSVTKESATSEVEHVILDNCSTDGSVEILREYAKRPGPMSVSLTVERDEGQTAAINRGLLRATGDIMCWLNTDEFLMPGALTEVSRFFGSHPEVDVAFGGCHFVDKDGRYVRTRREAFFSIPMLVYYGCFIPSCSTFFRRRIVDEGNILDPSFNVAMDHEWYTRLAARGYRFASVDVELAVFTWHGSNKSSVLRRRRVAERRLVQDRYSSMPVPSSVRHAAYSLVALFWRGIRWFRNRPWGKHRGLRNDSISA